MKRFAQQAIGCVTAAVVLWSTPARVFAQASSALEKIVITYQAKTITSYFIPAVAKARGFFQKEGLDVELLYIRGGQLDVTALISGQTDYSVGGGGAITAFVAGLPLRSVVNLINRADQTVLAQPKYISLKDLKGQTIASQNPGGAMDTLLRQILTRDGLNADRDVIFMNMGGSQERYNALNSGTVAATILGTPHNLRAERAGFRRLARASDYIDGSVSGLVVRADWIAKRPEQIRKVIRAVLRGSGYVRENPKESIQMISRDFTMDQDMATASYHQLLEIMSPDGRFSLGAVQFLIDLARKAQKVQREIPAAHFIEFPLLQEAQRELGLVR